MTAPCMSEPEPYLDNKIEICLFPSPEMSIALTNLFKKY